MTKEELENVAILSKLEIKDDEIDEILKDMQNIIKFTDGINKAQTKDLNHDFSNSLQNVLREDVIIKSYEQEEILKNSKTKEDGFFYLKNSVGG